jgi:hypothetical protein
MTETHIQGVKIFEQSIVNSRTRRTVGKIAILVGGLDRDNPKEFMDQVVQQYVGSVGHNQFIEIHLDNPWTRVVTDCINDVELRDITILDSISRPC